MRTFSGAPDPGSDGHRRPTIRQLDALRRPGRQVPAPCDVAGAHGARRRRGSPPGRTRPPSWPAPTSTCGRRRPPAGRRAAHARPRSGAARTDRPPPPTGTGRPPAAAVAAISVVMRFCSSTVSSATPSEPPTRCSTLSCGVARGTCERSSVAYAAAIAGIIVAPSPTPRSSSPTAEQPVRRVRRRRSRRAASRRAGSSGPRGRRGPAPTRSVSRPPTFIRDRRAEALRHEQQPRLKGDSPRAIW